MLRALTTVGLSEIEEAIVKATFRDDERPKEKHVERILEHTNDFPQENIVPFFIERLHGETWQRVLKTLSVVHLLCRDGHPKFLQHCSLYVNDFDLSTFLDRSTPDSHAPSRTVRSYGEYLSQKLRVFAKIGTCAERYVQRAGRDWLMGLGVNDLVQFVEMVVEQFGMLMQIKLPFPSLVHPIVAFAFKLLLRDAHRLYTLINVAFLRVLEEVSQLSSPQARKVTQAYEKFIDYNERFRRWSAELVDAQLSARDILPDFDALAATKDTTLQVLRSVADAVKISGDEKQNGSAVKKKHGSHKAGNTKKNPEVQDLKDLLGDELKLVVERVPQQAGDSDRGGKKKKKEKKEKKEKKKTKSKTTTDDGGAAKSHQPSNNFADAFESSAAAAPVEDEFDAIFGAGDASAGPSAHAAPAPAAKRRSKRNSDTTAQKQSEVADPLAALFGEPAAGPAAASSVGGGDDILGALFDGPTSPQAQAPASASVQNPWGGGAAAAAAAQQQYSYGQAGGGYGQQQYSAQPAGWQQQPQQRPVQSADPFAGLSHGTVHRAPAISRARAPTAKPKALAQRIP